MLQIFIIACSTWILRLTRITDDATFTRRGGVNMRNLHRYVHISIGTDLVNNLVTGACTRQARLNAAKQLQFFTKEFTLLLEDASLNIR